MQEPHAIRKEETAPTDGIAVGTTRAALAQTIDFVQSVTLALEQAAGSPGLVANEAVLEKTIAIKVQPSALPGATGRTVGRYQILRELGRGGFGAVYLAFDDRLNRQVAIKEALPSMALRPEQIEAYLSEARKLASLDDPGIVPVYDVGQTADGRWFVVSKYIAGGSLADRVRGRRLAPREAVELVAQVADALHYSHRCDLVHRDVKPANILLDANGKSYLADFGLAISGHESGPGSGCVGTLPYMSPEQADGRGNRLDGRSDVFSLGVVFYELLTQRRPFRGKTALELRTQIVMQEPEPPRQIDETIPVELEVICLKALRKELTQRYATAKDFATDLRQHLRERNASPPRVQPGNEPRRGEAVAGRSFETPLIDSPSAALKAQQYAAADGLGMEWTNDRGLRFRLIPAGRFWMGAAPDDPLAKSNEKPRQLRVVDQPFWAAAFPVTNRTIRELLRSGDTSAEAATLFRDSNFAPHCCSGAHDDDWPLVEINARDADLLCAWLRRRDRMPYRLPTEVEWEYLARAGASSAFHWERDARPDGRAVWNAASPAAANDQRANSWGLIDTLGNVAEWTSSTYAPFSSDACTRPAGPLDGESRVVRGGSYGDQLDGLRLSRRTSMAASVRKNYLGIRLVCDIDASV